MAATLFLSGFAIVAAGSSWVYREAVKETGKVILDHSGPVGKWIKDSYTDYKDFKEFIQEDYDNTVALHYAMMSMVITARYRAMKKKVITTHDHLTHTRSTAVPKKVKEPHPDTHEIEYYYNDQVYVMKINTPALFEELISVEDSNGKNVKKELEKYLGPAHDFHGLSYTPNELGYESLEFSNGLESLKFTGDEPIVLKFEI
jgi:hypothetical protein